MVPGGRPRPGLDHHQPLRRTSQGWTTHSLSTMVCFGLVLFLPVTVGSVSCGLFIFHFPFVLEISIYHNSFVECF